MVFEKGDIVTCIKNPDDDYIYTKPGVECFVVHSDSQYTHLFVLSNFPEKDWYKKEMYDDRVWQVDTHNFQIIKKHFNNPFSKIKSLLR